MNEKKRFPRYGKYSMLLSFGSLVLSIVLLFILQWSEHYIQNNPDSYFFITALIGLIGMLCASGFLVSFGLGIAGLFLKNQVKFYAYIGAVLSGLMLILILIIFTIFVP
jgi:hypothetical protein